MIECCVCLRELAGRWALLVDGRGAHADCAEQAGHEVAKIIESEGQRAA